MADSTAGGQDAAARINGLMGSLGRRTSERDEAVARVAELEAQLQAAQESAAQSAHSQQPDPLAGLEPDVDYRLVDGQLVAQEGPRPIGTNPQRRLGADRDDGTSQYLRDKLARDGHTTRDTSWP